jgi:hypothetical protein
MNEHQTSQQRMLQSRQAIADAMQPHVSVSQGTGLSGSLWQIAENALAGPLMRAARQVVAEHPLRAVGGVALVMGVIVCVRPWRWLGGAPAVQALAAELLVISITKAMAQQAKKRQSDQIR